MNDRFPPGVYENLIYIYSCAVNGTAPDPAKLEAAPLDAVLSAAQFHMVAAACAHALKQAGIKNEGFEKELAVAQRNAALFDYERARIIESLEKKGIRYMPLKGVIIKDLYPAFGIRQMADNDIWIEPGKAGAVRDIMLDYGFDVKSFDAFYDDVYIKKPVLNFEIHRYLVSPESNKKVYAYYSGVESRMIKDENNSFGYHFSDSDFYIYLIIHEFKHFYAGGTGLRSLADTYLCSKKLKIDYDYVENELKKTGTADFEKQIRGLSVRLFSGETLNSGDELMLDYVMNSGTFGNVNNFLKNRIEKKGRGITGKISYLFSRVFLSMNTVRVLFPFFYRHKVLLPLLPFYRLIASLRKGNGNLKRELSVIRGKK